MCGHVGGGNPSTCIHIFLAVGGTTMANIQKTSIAVAEGTGPEIHHSSQEEGQEQQDLVIIGI